MSPGRHIKIIALSKNFLLLYLQGLHNFDSVSWPVTPEIPEGCEIRNIYYDHNTESFDVMLWHPSFPIVPPGERPPRFIPDFFGQEEMVFRRKLITETHY